MTWENDVHSTCHLNADEHDHLEDDAGKIHRVCPAWLTEGSAA